MAEAPYTPIIISLHYLIKKINIHILVVAKGRVVGKHFAVLEKIRNNWYSMILFLLQWWYKIFSHLAIISKDVTMRVFLVNPINSCSIGFLQFYETCDQLLHPYI